LSIPSGFALAQENYVDAGNVSVTWAMKGMDMSKRLTNVSFPFVVNKDTLRKSGTYFAQQFFFDGVNNGAYLGLQPREDKNGKTYIRGVFSSFIEGSTSTDSNCSDGADGGAGVSCGFEFPASYGEEYTITVTKTNNTTWSGDAIHRKSGQVIHIGSWSLPDNVGDIMPSGGGFIEYYAYYEPGYPQFVVPECDKLAKVDVIFGPVQSTNYGGVVGDISNPYEYNTKECLSEASGYSAVPNENYIGLPDGSTVSAVGYRIVRGFVSN
ncbi:hypothetical protein SNN83_004487, partial [Cronobacter malonaticus]|nr:hypothetical protein [Cronobacter malonaticus]